MRYGPSTCSKMYNGEQWSLCCDGNHVNLDNDSSRGGGGNSIPMIHLSTKQVGENNLLVATLFFSLCSERKRKPWEDEKEKTNRERAQSNRILLRSNGSFSRQSDVMRSLTRVESLNTPWYSNNRLENGREHYLNRVCSFKKKWQLLSPSIAGLTKVPQIKLPPPPQKKKKKKFNFLQFPFEHFKNRLMFKYIDTLKFIDA